MRRGLLGHRRWLAAMTLIALPVLSPHPVHASPNSVAGMCVHMSQWSFSPALTQANSSGTITATYSGSCEDAWALYNSPSDFQVVQQNWGQGWTWSDTYSGNCVLATTTWNSGQGSGLLVGGTVSVAHFSSPGYTASESAELDVIAVASPGACNEATGTGASLLGGDSTW
jgi:hypothetical protein